MDAEALSRMSPRRDNASGCARQELVLQGTDGDLTVGLWSAELILGRKRGKAFQRFERLRLNPVRRGRDASFVEQLFWFAKAIGEGGPVPVSGLDGLKAVEVVERAYQWASVGHARA